METQAALPSCHFVISDPDDWAHNGAARRSAGRALDKRFFTVELASKGQSYPHCTRAARGRPPARDDGEVKAASNELKEAHIANGHQRRNAQHPRAPKKSPERIL